MLTQMTYQGLFHFVSGLATFSTILLVLRSLSIKRECNLGVQQDTDSTWHTKEQLAIVEIIEETHDIKSFRFKRANHKSFKTFLPGQFLSFQIGDDVKLLRSYSLSASCENNTILQVSIKHLKDGVGSGWFHARKAGDNVWAFPPSGLFTDAPLTSEDRIYVAGGIGITPLLSMILTGLERSTKANRYLFYGIQTAKDAAFHSLLVALADRFNHFKYFPIMSKDPAWGGDKGYVNLAFIKSKITVGANTNIFFCGPPVMTDGIYDQLVAEGHLEKRLHREKFASPVAFDPATIPHHEATIKLGGKNYSYKGKESLLEFLEQQTIEVPFACRVGVCGSCKCKVKSGTVDAVTDFGLTDNDKKAGYVLSCVARPTSDIDIEF